MTNYKKLYCLICEKEGKTTELPLPSRGAPRKYCSEHTAAAQREKDLQNKRLKRGKERIINLLKSAKSDPDAIREVGNLVKNLVENLDDSGQRREEMIDLIEEVDMSERQRARQLQPHHPAFDLYPRTRSLSYQIQKSIFDKPRKWSEEELVILIKKVIKPGDYYYLESTQND